MSRKRSRGYAHHMLIRAPEKERKDSRRFIPYTFQTNKIRHEPVRQDITEPSRKSIVSSYRP